MAAVTMLIVNTWKEIGRAIDSKQCPPPPPPPPPPHTRFSEPSKAHTGIV